MDGYGLAVQVSKHFPPMPHRQRWVLHAMAEFHGLESESFDKEPKR